MKCAICSEEITDGQAKLTIGDQDYHEACLVVEQMVITDQDSASKNPDEPEDSDDLPPTLNR